MELKPLSVNTKVCSLRGNFYNIATYDEYVENKQLTDLAIEKEVDGVNIILPVRGKYSSKVTQPGIYDAGCIDFIIYPENINDYVPNKIVQMNNQDDIKEMVKKKNIINRLDEPWITSPDNITVITIDEEDSGAMKGLKSAINAKNIDLDKYGPRFGDNFNNDKRQLKNKNVTLNIIQRFCENLDMEALITFRDKSPNVPNPMGTEIVVSINDEYNEDGN